MNFRAIGMENWWGHVAQYFTGNGATQGVNYILGNWHRLAQPVHGVSYLRHERERTIVTYVKEETWIRISVMFAKQTHDYLCGRYEEYCDL